MAGAESWVPLTAPCSHRRGLCVTPWVPGAAQRCAPRLCSAEPRGEHRVPSGHLQLPSFPPPCAFLARAKLRAGRAGSAGNETVLGWRLLHLCPWPMCSSLAAQGWDLPAAKHELGGSACSLWAFSPLAPGGRLLKPGVVLLWLESANCCAHVELVG